MKKLEDDDLKNIEGGMSIASAIGIGLAITFIAGIFDGIARPLSCRE